MVAILQGTARDRGGPWMERVRELREEQLLGGVRDNIFNFSAYILYNSGSIYPRFDLNMHIATIHKIYTPFSFR